MAEFFDVFENKQRIVPVIFAIDASGSMAGERILAVNKALRTVLDQLEEVNLSGKSLMEYAVLRFASGAEWLTDGFIEPDSAKAPVIKAGGLTCLGDALERIEERLRFFKENKTRYHFPIICFITDGAPTDDYKTPLKRLCYNAWYKNATKFAMAIESGDCSSVMMEVCGNAESIFKLEGVSKLEKFMVVMFGNLTRSVTITASAVSDNASDFIGSTDELFDSFWDEGDNDGVDVDRDSDGETDDATPAPAFPLYKDASSSPHVPVDFGCCYSKIEIQDLRRRSFPNDRYVGRVKRNGLSSNHLETPQPFKISQVEFSAIVPKKIVNGECAMLDIAVYEEAHRCIVDRIISGATGEVREVIGSPREVAENTVIRIMLSSPDIDLSLCNEEQVWRGRYLTYSFPIDIPSDYALPQIRAVAWVYFNEVIATKLTFIVDCTAKKEQKPFIARNDISTAFVSYARKDRRKVARIIQGMQKARPDMDIFFDIDSIRSGEYWQERLMEEIYNRDILFLCWSKNAKKSQWVEREWRYAFDNKGLDSIDPIPLVSPGKCPPPKELNTKHFNDRALFYMKL